MEEVTERNKTEVEHRENIEEEQTRLHEDTDTKAKGPRLVLVRGPVFDFCSAAVTVIISFGVVLNYLVLSDRVKLKDVPFASKREEPAYALDHQRAFSFPNAEISSHFDGGNARSVTQDAPYEFEVKAGGEPGNGLRRWFYFSVSGIQQPVTISFSVSNISLDVNLLKNGLVPVFKSESSGKIWSRLEDVTRIRQVDTNELEVEFSYQYDPASDGTIFFAMAYPWSYRSNQLFYGTIEKTYHDHQRVLFQRHKITTTSQGNRLDAILLSSKAHIDSSKKVNYGSVQFPTVGFEKKFVAITARMHGFESVSSLALKHIVKYLLTENPLSMDLMDNYFFVIIPMLNPDGVKLGLNLFDSSKNDIDNSFPMANANVSSECVEIKKLFADLGATGRLTAVLNLRSTLDENVVKIRVPSISKEEINRYLPFPYYLSADIKDYDRGKHISVTASNFLRELSILAKDAMIAEINVPTMKRSKDAMGQVISTDIETVVNGVGAAQGGIGIRQISRKIINALHKTLIGDLPTKNATVATPSPVITKPTNNTQNTTSPTNTTTPQPEQPPKPSRQPVVNKKLRKKLEELYQVIMQLNVHK
jgi:hypothetical protein